MSIGDELRDGLNKKRPHRLKGATHHLFIQVWHSIDQNRKVIYENLELPLPATPSMPVSGPEYEILVQLLYQHYIPGEVEHWPAREWHAAAAQASPKLLEHLLLAATSYECGNTEAALALIDAYRRSRFFKERFLYHADIFSLATGGEPLQEGPSHIHMKDGLLLPKKKKKTAGRKKTR